MLHPSIHPRLRVGLTSTHVNCTLYIVNSSVNKIKKRKKRRNGRSWSVTADSRSEVAYKVTRDFTVKSPLLKAFGPVPAGFSRPLFPSSLPAPRVTLPPRYSARSRFHSTVVVSPSQLLYLLLPSSSSSSSPSSTTSITFAVFFNHLPIDVSSGPFHLQRDSPRPRARSRNVGTQVLVDISRFQNETGITQGYNVVLR